MAQRLTLILKTLESRWQVKISKDQRVHNWSYRYTTNMFCRWGNYSAKFHRKMSVGQIRLAMSTHAALKNRQNRHTSVKTEARWLVQSLKVNADTWPATFLLFCLHSRALTLCSLTIKGGTAGSELFIWLQIQSATEFIWVLGGPHPELSVCSL